MVGCQDLPLEVRLQIYGNIFDNARLKYVKDLKKPYPSHPDAKLAPCVSLLICAKWVFAEAKFVFFQQVRLEVSDLVKGECGGLSNGLDASMLRHVKLNNAALHAVSIKKLLKSMTNLESLTYLSAPCVLLAPEMADIAAEHHLHYCGDGDDDEDYCQLGCPDCAERASKDCCYLEQLRSLAIDQIQEDVTERHGSITGRCSCDSPAYGTFDSDECVGEWPFRPIVAGWDWLERPYQLIAQVHVDDGTGDLDVVSLSIEGSS
jgi:hypothetical protein